MGVTEPRQEKWALLSALLIAACTPAAPSDPGSGRGPGPDHVRPERPPRALVPEWRALPPVEPEPVVDEGSQLTQGGAVVCDDPTLVDTLGPFDRWQVVIPLPQVVHVEGANATVADLNNDGVLDILVTGEHEVFGWFGLDQVELVPPTILLAIPTPAPRTGLFGSTAADIDDDGDLDLVVTGRGVEDHLLLNDGAGGFTDATAGCGLDAYPTHHSTGASFADFDKDGDLDLFIAGHGFMDETLEYVTQFLPGEPSRLYVNDGGHFTDVSDRIPAPAHDGYTFMGGWIDAEGDGDEDLYLVNDFGNVLAPSQLLLNDGGTFVEDGGALGMDLPLAGMGFGVGDLDNDGDEEVALPAWNRNGLLYRDAGLWFDQAQARGYRPRRDQTVGWGAEIIDADNDGLMDIVTPYGWVDSRFGQDNNLDQADGLYMQVRPGEFADQADLAAFGDLASHRSAAPGDLNRDGYPDFVKVGLDGYLRIDVSRCDDQSWLNVSLRQPPPNTGAVGAEVRVTANGQTWMRRLRAGGTGFGPGQPQELMFGLGTADHIDELVVTWPDGTTEPWTDLAVNQQVWIERGP